MPSTLDPDLPLAVPLPAMLRRIDAGLVLPVGGPPADTVSVRTVGIRDAGDPRHRPDALLIAPGLDLYGAEGAAALQVMATHEVTAVVVRHAEQAADAVWPINVMTLDASMTWDRAFLLLSAALDGAQAEAAGAPTGGPVERLGDLFAFADAVCDAVEGNVVILDAQNRVLAFSGSDQPADEWRQGTILGRRVPADWERRFRDEGIYERMRTPGAVVTFSLPDNPSFRPRRAIGVHAGGRVIGILAVAEGSRPFDDRTDDILREAARVGALQLLRHSARQAVGARRQEERLRGLLSGDHASADTVARLGVRTEFPFVVAAIAARGGPEAAIEDVGSLLRMRLPSDVEMVSVVDGTRLYALLTGPAATLGGLATDPTWFRGSPAPRRGLVAGLSRPVDRAEDIPVAREEADQVVDAMVKGAIRRDVASPEQAWTALVLARAEDLVLSDDGLQYGRAAMLAEHDRAHGTDYVATLHCFLRHRGESGQAAEELHIHPNTLRYRVRRACDIAAIDLDNPADRLVFELQLSALSRS